MTPAIDELTAHLGLPNLYSQSYLAQERKRIEHEEKKRPTVPDWKKAPVFWAEALPQGYSYARGDMASNMGRFFPGWSFGDMMVLMARVAEYAKEAGTQHIAYTEHILPALYEFGIQPPM